jgi:class 3 adenylate cyclase/CHASE2 domain-containing sensor protein
MTAPERRQLRRNLVLGAVLTALIVAGTALGAFNRLEGWLYDMRTRHCQRHMPPPTDKLVHLDIDDDTLELIGGWPWPRSTMAAVLEEVHRAGAKALALDVLYVDRPLLESVTRLRAKSRSATTAPSTQPSTRPDPDGRSDPSPSGPTDDQLLAEAIRRFPASVVPVTFRLSPPEGKSLRLHQLASELKKNLELPREEAERLLGETIPQDEFLDALASAAAARIRDEKGATELSFDALRLRLLPKTSATFGARGTVQARVLEKEFIEFNALEAMHHLERPLESGLPRLLQPTDESAPLPEMSRAATAAGFVDFVPASDGVVRSLPLWVDCHHRLVPQFALSLACAYLGVDINAVRLSPNSLELPRPGQPPVVIPVRTERSSRLGEMGMFVDIPYFGREEHWESMYDYPAHVHPKQHVPVAFVWDTIQLRERIRSNNETVDEALLLMLELQGARKKLAALRSSPPPADDVASRLAMIADVQKDDAIKYYLDSERSKPQAEVASLTPTQREGREKILRAWDALPVVADQNRLLTEQLQQQEAGLKNLFGGKAVIVGWTATGTSDVVTTSMHAQCPGVVVHGVLFNAILNNHFRSRAPVWVTLAITAVMGVLCTLTVARLPGRWAMACTGGLVLAYLAFNGWFLFDRQRLIVGAAGPLVAGAGVWTVLSLVRYVTETAERNRVTRRFRSYVDPALVTYVLEHPEREFLKGEIREMTVVFTDLEGFTALTERMREQAVPILSDFMSRMVPVIRRNRGFVNKFMGDGIMFFFNAPEENQDHAAAAVTTAMDMQEEMERFNEALLAKGSPTVVMRVGVSTGPMVVGDAGDATRSDYTVLGDAVNLASRLESSNKFFGTRVLVSERTMERIGDRFLFRPVGRIRVKGKAEGVMAYEPLCMLESATQEQRRFAQACQAVVDCFSGGRFEDCLLALHQLEQANGVSAEKWCGVYREICQTYITTPPRLFDRTIVLNEK